jgi:hypothetical protein
MNHASRVMGSERSGSQPAPRGTGWFGSLILALALLFIYMINGRELGSEDTYSASLLPLNILRGDGIYLNNERLGNEDLTEPIPFCFAIARGHIVTVYPLAPALVELPLVAPQVAVLDLYRPGWDRDRQAVIRECMFMGKRSMAVIVALVGVVLHRLLLSLGVRRAAVPAVIAACLGSDLWTVASQAPWQHGPAALCLVTAIALLDVRPLSPPRLALAGLATTFLFACRAMDAVFAAAIVGWLGWTNWRGLIWLLPAPLLGGLTMIGYNLWMFGTILGGQAQLERLHIFRHGVSGPWSGNLLEGLVGTLFSPNRGLFVFSPWIAVGLASLLVPAVARRLKSHSLLVALMAALVPYLLSLSKYSVWWGGHCFGPRYWTDVVPLFAIIFAFGLEWMLDRSRLLAVFSAITVVISIAVQCVGAFWYPSTWNTQPTNVDLQHERLWNWRDTELARCVFEALARRPG